MSLASARSNRVFCGASDREVLLQARTLRIDSEGRKCSTLGALSLMGSHRRRSSPQLMMKRCCSPGEELTEVTEDGRRFLDNHSCTGPIPSMLMKLKAFWFAIAKTSNDGGPNSSW